MSGAGPAAREGAASAEEVARGVVQRLRDAGFVAYYAGGCVRDALLGRQPSDVDVATSARPEQVKALFRRTVGVGEQFGIVIVVQRGQEIEVATFRADGDYKDGRRPEAVAYSHDAEADAQRRDFTVNGLFFDPLSDRVIDHVGGLDDLRRGRIRAIGDPTRRFDEDKLRILRAPRFAAVLGFQLDERTAAEARRRAPDILAAKVSPERIRAELLKLLLCPGRALGLALCRDLSLLEVVLPEVLPDPPRVERALAALPPAVSTALAWAAALHLAAPGRADAALRRLRCSNEEREAAVALLAALPEACTLAELPLARQKRLLRALPGGAGAGDDLAALVRAVALAEGGDLEPYRYLESRRRAYAEDPSPAGVQAPSLISGRDLLGAGLRPGKAIGRLLAAVEDAQLEGRVVDRAGALALALALAGQG